MGLFDAATSFCERRAATPGSEGREGGRGGGRGGDGCAHSYHQVAPTGCRFGIFSFIWIRPCLVTVAR